MRRRLGTWGRVTAGVLVGGLSGVAGGVYTLCVAALLVVTAPWPPARRALARAAMAGARWLVAGERARLAWFFREPVATGHPSGRRLLGYLLVRGSTMPLAALAMSAGLVLGGALALLPLYWYTAWLTADLAPEAYLEGVEFYTTIGWPLHIGGVEGTITNGTIVAAVLLGLLLLYLMSRLAAAVAAGDRRLADRFFGPGAREVLERRITELTASRAGVMAAVDEERRRIERDLHDGVQQRVVALGALLGRARHVGDRDRAGELLGQAQEQYRQVLAELREVAQRVYPSVLDELGLDAALAGVTDDAGLPATLDYRLDDRPARQVETAVYFAVRELVTNAVKHARAGRVDVDVHEDGPDIVVRVRDDGAGGADPDAGTGLAGLARRVAALDGRLQMDSPPGAGTTVTARLPRSPATGASG